MTATEQLFSVVARTAFRHSRLLLGLVLFLLISSPYALRGLRLETDFSRVVPPSDPLVRTYRQNRALFGEATPLVVRLVFAGARQQEVDDFTEGLADSLRDWVDVIAVDFSPLDFRDIDESALMLRAALLNSTPTLLPSFRSRFSEEGLRRQLARSRRNLITLDEPGVRELLIADILNLREILTPVLDKRSHWSGSLGESKYFDDTEGASRIVMIHLSGSSEDSAYCTMLMDRLEGAVQDLKNEMEGARSIKVQVTGFHVMTGESARTLEKEMAGITAAAAAGLFLVTWVSFGNIRATIVCFFPLVISMLAVLVLARALFNPVYFLTIGFAAIVIGLGLDIGLHLTARFVHFARTSSTAAAVEKAMVECGPPILIGMATTAAAFLSLTVAKNEGLKQFGMLTSSGLILTLVVTFTVFPVVAGIFTPRQAMSGPLFAVRGAPRRLIAFATSRSRTAFAVALIIVGLSLPFAARFSLDMNIQHLFPRDLSAIAAARDTGKAFGMSFTSVTQVTIESPSYKQALSAQKTLDGELERMVQRDEINSFESASTFLVYPWGAKVFARPRLDEVLEGRPEFFRLLEELRFRRDPIFESYYDMLQRAAVPSRWELDDPPASQLVSGRLKRYVAFSDGAYRLQTYVWPKPEGEGFELGAYEMVSERMENLTVPPGVSLQVTGTLPIYERINQLVRSDFSRVSWLGALLVAGLVLLFFREIPAAVMAFVPLAAALPITAAAVVLLDIPFTPTGIAFASIIMGVGIDDSVHVIARARRGDGKQLKDVIEEIGPVIGLTTLSTMIGFGALALSSHAVVSSLGQVIAIGVLACWFFTLFLLPTVFSILSRIKPRFRRAAGGVALILVASAAAAAPVQESGNKILERVDERQDELEAGSCEYEQRKSLKQIGGTKSNNVLELVPLKGKGISFRRSRLELDSRYRLRRAVVEYYEEETTDTIFDNSQVSNGELVKKA